MQTSRERPEALRAEIDGLAAETETLEAERQAALGQRCLQPGFSVGVRFPLNTSDAVFGDTGTLVQWCLTISWQ